MTILATCFFDDGPHVMSAHTAFRGFPTLSTRARANTLGCYCDQLLEAFSPLAGSRDETTYAI